MVTMFAISELACASSSGIVVIKTAGFGINAVAWQRCQFCQCCPGSHACLENRPGLDIDGRRQIRQIVMRLGTSDNHGQRNEGTAPQTI